MRNVLIALVLVFAYLLLCAPGESVDAQDPTETPTPTPTPTITPTPSYLQAVPLSSGNTLIIERRITYGEIAVAVVGLVLIALLVVMAVMILPRVYL